VTVSSTALVSDAMALVNANGNVVPAGITLEPMVSSEPC
jgi:hypothetical protein